MSHYALAAAIASMTGCAATHTALTKQDMTVDTRMSESVFLEPAAPERMVAWVRIRNTSGTQLPGLQAQVATELQHAGFRVTADPTVANYVVQANVLSLAKMDERTAADALQAGFGGAVGGVAVAAVAGMDGWQELGAVGLVVGGASMLADSLVQDGYVTLVTDLEIRERPLPGEQVTQSQATSYGQGSSTTVNQSSSTDAAAWKNYRTRVVVTANRINLEKHEAAPALQSALVASVGGVL